MVDELQTEAYDTQDCCVRRTIKQKAPISAYGYPYLRGDDL